MSSIRILLLVLGLLAPAGAGAQAVAAHPSAAETATTDTIRMDRAQRLAVGPMRAIAEAARVGRRAQAPEGREAGTGPTSAARAQAWAGPSHAVAAVAGAAAATSAAVATDPTPAIVAIIQFPADLGSILAPPSERLAPLPAAAPAVAPPALDALRALPWPDELRPPAPAMSPLRRLAQLI
jgi:hypothetical protein